MKIQGRRTFGYKWMQAISLHSDIHQYRRSCYTDETDSDIYDIVVKVVTFSECQNNFHWYEDIVIWLTLGFIVQTTKFLSDGNNNSSIWKSQEIKKYHQGSKRSFQLLVTFKTTPTVPYFNIVSKTQTF